MKTLIFALSLFCSLHVSAVEPLEIWGERYAPLGYSQNDTPAGMVTEIVRHLIKDSGIQVRNWKLAPWARVYMQGKTIPDTLIYTVVRQPDREDLFHWIGPVSDRNIYIYKLASRRDIVIHSWDDIKHYKVGSLLAGASTQNIQAHGIKPEKSETVAINFKKLLYGRVELVDMLDLSVAYFSRKHGLSPGFIEKVWLADNGKKYYIALHKETSPETVRLLQASFEKMRANGVLAKIQQKYDS
jgi:polar amino acid transport system substrate-binding protein